MATAAQALPMQKVELEILEHQAQLLAATESRAILSGGYGSGKTHALVLGALDFSARFPGVPHGVVAPTFKMLAKDVLPACRAILRTLGVAFEEHRTDHWIRPSWSRHEDALLWFASAEDPNAMKGPNWGTACINEPGIITREAYEVVISRTRVPLVCCGGCDLYRGDEPGILGDRRRTARERYDAAAPCRRCGSSACYVHPNYLRLAGTPEGFNWLYDEFVDETKHPDRDWSEWLRLWARTSDNPFTPSSYEASLLESYDEKLVQEKVGGQYVDTQRGRIYYRFDRAVHLGTPTHDPSLPLHVSWDFNVEPLCTVVGQVVGNRLLVLDQVVGSDSAKTEEVMWELARRYREQRAGWRIHGDVSGRNRDTRSKGQTNDYAIIRRVAEEARLSDFHVAVASHNPERRTRYDCVNGLLRNSKGEVRIVVHRERCRTLITDLERQHFRPGTALAADTLPGGGQSIGHSADALGYLCLAVFPPPAHHAGSFRIHA